MNKIYQSLKRSSIYSSHPLWRMHLILLKIISWEEESFKEDRQEMLVATL